MAATVVTFTAQYYQRSLGEVALAGPTAALRELSPPSMGKRVSNAGRFARKAAGVLAQAQAPVAVEPLALSHEQAHALDAITTEPGPSCSLVPPAAARPRCTCRRSPLHADPAAQALVMVPEINLTPQLEARFAARFAPRFGAQAVVSLHSAMTPAQRLNAWLAAHRGSARIVLGTRMAVLASLPGLCLVVVDEEHDPSYKAAGRRALLGPRPGRVPGAPGRCQGHPGVGHTVTGKLAPCTPADQGGRYRRLDMGQRSTAGAPSTGTADWPTVRRVDMQHQPRGCVIAPPCWRPSGARVRAANKSLLLLNRRGYAPVLHCADCGWKPTARTAARFGRLPQDRPQPALPPLRLASGCRGLPLSAAMPTSAPSAAAPSAWKSTWPNCWWTRRPSSAEFPDGAPVRIARIDADTTRAQGPCSQLAAVHAGDVDVLVGTQMAAKGHDFGASPWWRAINPDGALFSSDYRAPERLFAPADGRRTRRARPPCAAHSEVRIQPSRSTTPFAAPRRTTTRPLPKPSCEREQAAPATLHGAGAGARRGPHQAVAQAFLNAARDAALRDMAAWDGWVDVLAQITLYGAVPMALQRVANVERAPGGKPFARRAAAVPGRLAATAARRAQPARGPRPDPLGDRRGPAGPSNGSTMPSPARHKHHASPPKCAVTTSIG